MDGGPDCEREGWSEARKTKQGRSGQRAGTSGDLVGEQRASARERERRSEAKGRARRKEEEGFSFASSVGDESFECDNPFTVHEANQQMPPIFRSERLETT